MSQWLFDVGRTPMGRPARLFGTHFCGPWPNHGGGAQLRGGGQRIGYIQGYPSLNAIANASGSFLKEFESNS